MKGLVKILAGITIFILFIADAHGQPHNTSKNNIAADIKKVLEDYSNNFANITGDLIIQNPQSADYACNLKVDGAQDCIITKYSSTQNNVYSWQATMLTTESFDEAKKKFHSLYTQLNNLHTASFVLDGLYENPTEEKKFASVLLSAHSGKDDTSKLKVEILLESELLEWKVKVLVYSKEREDDERGKVIEE